jgi:hypothetical protein
MSRYTPANLRSTIAELNDSLAEFGFSVRFECGGRNGYQAVDEFSVFPDGTRNGSGVNCTVCCGSSRECAQAARERYYTLANNASREALERELAALRG